MEREVIPIKRHFVSGKLVEKLRNTVGRPERLLGGEGRFGILSCEFLETLTSFNHQSSSNKEGTKPYPKLRATSLKVPGILSVPSSELALYLRGV